MSGVLPILAKLAFNSTDISHPQGAEYCTENETAREDGVNSTSDAAISTIKTAQESDPTGDEAGDR